MFKYKDFLQEKFENIKSFEETKDIGDKSKFNEYLDNLKKKYISQKLNEINSEGQNSHLDIMLGDLAIYKNEKSISISKNMKQIGISTHKRLVYNYLEKHLVEASYIPDKEKRNDKINEIYQWYTGNLKFEKDIKTITYKTYKEKNVIDEKEYFSMKFGNKPKTDDLEANHRNMEYINKQMLNDIQRKKLSKPYWALKKAISSKMSSSQENKSFLPSTNFSRNTLDKIDLNTLYSSSKGTNVPSKKNYNAEIFSYRDKPKGETSEKEYNIMNQEIEFSFLTPMNREKKFSYSYFSPLQDLSDIYLENQINEEKNKCIAWKRNQEEIKEKIKEFGLYRAKFKEYANNKLDMKHLINIYVNKNKLSSSMLKRYKMKEQEKIEKKVEDIKPKIIESPKVLEKVEVNQRRGSVNIFNLKFFSEKIFKKRKKEEENNNESNNTNYLNSESGQNETDSKRQRSNSLTKIKVDTSFTPKVSLFKLNKESNKDNSQDKNTTNFIKKFRNSLSKRLSIKKKKKKTSIKKKTINLLSKLINIKLFSGNNNKVQTGNINNLEKESKIIKLTDNTKIKDYQFNYDQEKNNSELLNKNKKENNYDALPNIIMNENISKEKLTYQKLCKIYPDKAHPPNIDSDIGLRTKMMVFNKGNVEEINKQIVDKMKKRNHFEKLQNSYLKFRNNLLNMRKSLSTDKRIEYEGLIDAIRFQKLQRLQNPELNEEDEIDETEIEDKKINSLFEYRFKKKTDNINKSLLNALVNPKDNSNFSRYYLPRNGSMLLSKEKAKKLFKKFLN